MFNSKQSGFTMVELAIVIVIIGLLIGGILAAQSMGETSKVQAQIRQIGQSDAAVVSFADKYAGMPGDTSSFEVIGSNQDNLVVDSSADGMYDEESAEFWPQLSASGFKREEGGEYNNSYIVGTSYPRAAIGYKDNGLLVHGSEDPEILGNGTIGNAYILANCGAMTSAALNCESGLSGNQAIAIDQKLDDGDLTKGNTRGMDLASDAGTDTWTDILDATATAIPAGKTEDAAVLVIRIGATAGNLK